MTDAALSQIVVQAAESGRRARTCAAGATSRSASWTPARRVQLGLAVAYGRVLPDVARAVQEQVAAALGTMCGVTVTAVDVAIEELA